MDAKLVVVSGETQANEYPLSLPTIVGRSRSADITLGHNLVSRKHCELYESDGRLVIRDLGSLNGTFVGDTRISDATVLPPGATVTIGAVTLKAVYGDMRSSDITSQPSDAAAAVPPSPQATAAPIEQTLEMEDFSSPATEPTANVESNAGFNFDWLEESNSQDDAPNAESAAASGPSDDVAVAMAQSEQPAEETATGDDDDLSNFFASLK